jgi:hypothetical protein
MVAKNAMMIGTRAGAHLLTFCSERAEAQTAEAILRQMPLGAAPAPVWISCRDPSIAQRLALYLKDLQDEMTAMAFDA